jgi:hypothetical protein
MQIKTTGPTLLSGNLISHILPIPSIQVITAIQTLHPITRIQLAWDHICMSMEGCTPHVGIVDNMKSNKPPHLREQYYITLEDSITYRSLIIRFPHINSVFLGII